jgi:hypothetical protein
MRGSGVALLVESTRIVSTAKCVGVSTPIPATVPATKATVGIATATFVVFVTETTCEALRNPREPREPSGYVSYTWLESIIGPPNANHLSPKRMTYSQR